MIDKIRDAVFGALVVGTMVFVIVCGVMCARCTVGAPHYGTCINGVPHK